MQEQQRITHQFKIHLTRLGYQQGSVRMLPSCVAEFLSFSGKQVCEVSKSDVESYYKYLQERPNKRREGGLSGRSIAHHIYSLKTFFSWLEVSNQLQSNPMSGLQFDRVEHKQRQILTIAEVKQLYAVTESLRERAILSIFYGCGLRRSEGVQLNLRDVHFRSNLLYVRSGKNGKRRAVPMSEKVKSDLWNYVLNERFSQAQETAFICGIRGKRLLGNGLISALKKIVKRSELAKEVTLHSLRHSIATHLLESGLSLEYVREFLGHKHLETTQIYTRVSKEQLWNLSNI